MDYLFSVIAVVLAYLLGSLSFAVIVSRALGLKDPRSYGSHNPGATNVLRSGSKKAAIATLLLDGLKGWLPVVLVKWFGKDYGLEDGTMAAVAFAAFLGHLFPVFSSFRVARAWQPLRVRCWALSGCWGWLRWPPGSSLRISRVTRLWRQWPVPPLRRCFIYLVIARPGIQSAAY